MVLQFSALRDSFFAKDSCPRYWRDELCTPQQTVVSVSWSVDESEGATSTVAFRFFLACPIFTDDPSHAHAHRASQPT